MSRISISKLALVLVLATVLTPATGWSAGRRFSTDDSTARIFITENPLLVFWNYIVGLWDKEGCGIDPDGSCDAGCGLDPSGCVTSSSESAPKNGCGLDPHGANCT